MSTSSPIPAARDDDPEDVAWALSTAATQWTRGDRMEALKWLRRAADAASEADKDSRALELAKAAADLTTPSMPPPSRPAPMVTPKAPPISTRAIPPSPPSRPTVPPAPVTKPGPKFSAQATTKRASSKPPTKTSSKSKPDIRPRPPGYVVGTEDRTDTHIVTEVTRLDTKPPTHGAASEADAWPTESMGAGELDSLNSEEIYGTERTRIGSPAYRPSDPPPGQSVPFRASQAVHVVIWRDADGKLRVAPRGTTVSAVTIEALLVAPSSEVDLLAWLSPT